MTTESLLIGNVAASSRHRDSTRGTVANPRPSPPEPSKEILAEIARRNIASISQDGDPFRRIGGGIVLHCKVDLDEGGISDVASVATMFRGYESLLHRRDLRDAGLISSTASGICGGVHAATSAQCLEMALDLRPPPLGIVARNLLLSCQYLNDNPMHLFVLAGPDYSARTVEATNPEIWHKARSATAAHRSVHRYETIGEIMTALNRTTGALFLEALDMMRLARAAYALLGGKYPHSESIVPGGVNLSLTAGQLDAFAAKIEPFFDYAKRCARVWDDVCDFFYDADPRYLEVGRSSANLVDFGQWDHDEHYDASYANCTAWGEKRWSTPGAVIGGQLITTSLAALNAGMEEFVDRSYYDPWNEGTVSADPVGSRLSPNHPWNKSIQRNAARNSGAVPYSWATSLAWKRNVFEVGAYARLYVSALARKLPPSAFVASTGDGLVFQLNGGALARDRLEWRVPPVWNALERNRARAYAVAYNLAVTLENKGRAAQLLARGELTLRTPLEMPLSGRRFGVGFGGAGRGLLAHWAILDGTTIENYQIAIPSRINAGPRAPWGEPGACEQAVLNTPIIETGWTHQGDFQGIDIVRAIQSFDPCMPCKAEIRFNESDFVTTKEVTSDELI